MGRPLLDSFKERFIAQVQLKETLFRHRLGDSFGRGRGWDQKRFDF